MGYIGQDPRFKPISLFEFNDDNDLTPTDRFFPIEDPHFIFKFNINTHFF